MLCTGRRCQSNSAAICGLEIEDHYPWLAAVWQVVEPAPLIVHAPASSDFKTFCAKNMGVLRHFLGCLHALFSRVSI